MTTPQWIAVISASALLVGVAAAIVIGKMFATGKTPAEQDAEDEEQIKAITQPAKLEAAARMGGGTGEETERRARINEAVWSPYWGM